MKTEIGVVTINYSITGSVIKEKTNFKPTLEIPVAKEMENEFRAIRNNFDVDSLKSNSDLVFSSWFAKMNEIELADRTEYQISSEVLRCERYIDNSIKECVIKYFWEKITPKNS